MYNQINYFKHKEEFITTLNQEYELNSDERKIYLIPASRFSIDNTI